MELMRPANALLKRAPSTTDRLSDVHHVFIIDDTTGKPLFELTPGLRSRARRAPGSRARVLESRAVRAPLDLSKQKTPGFLIIHTNRIRVFSFLWS
ncbi:unnamed protein product [Bathycoccus prasinos]